MCYTAAGFRIAGKHGEELNYASGEHPLKLTRLTAERESRFEPISYWLATTLRPAWLTGRSSE
jgi:hypothetical protein